VAYAFQRQPDQTSKALSLVCRHLSAVSVSTCITQEQPGNRSTLTVSVRKKNLQDQSRRLFIRVGFHCRYSTQHCYDTLDEGNFKIPSQITNTCCFFV
jgi:hypothetical protein